MNRNLWTGWNGRNVVHTKDVCFFTLKYCLNTFQELNYFMAPRSPGWSLYFSLVASTFNYWRVARDVFEIQNHSAFAEMKVKCCDEACSLLTELICT